MAMRASPKAGRKKVRCPKCTAYFSDPAKAVFECPICWCRLSANGANALTESPRHQTREVDSGDRKAGLGNDDPIKMPSPVGFVEKVGYGMRQEEISINSDQDIVTSHAQIYKKKEQEPLLESPQIFQNGNATGVASVGSSTIEGINGKDGMSGTYPPMRSVRKLGNYMNGKDEGESLQHLSVDANEEAALVSITGQQSSDHALKEKSPMAREENDSIAAGEEWIEGHDCVINGVSNKRHLQAQIFRSSRNEFSFKYSLEGASPLQSDRDVLNQKRYSNDRTVSSEETLPKTEASDIPFCTPLRVRISKSHEESSDQIEHGRESFGSEMDSDGSSGSDFDFPAPWAEGLQEIVLPVSFGPNEAFHPNSETIISGAPHQLELQDDYDTIEHEKFTLPEELEKNLHVHDADSCHELLKTGEKNCGYPDNAEITTTEGKPLFRHTQGLDVSDLASCASSSMYQFAAGNNEVIFMNDSTQKLKRPGSQEFSEVGKEQEAGLKKSCQHEKLRNTEPNVQQEPCERLDMLVPSGGGQDVSMNDLSNGKQERALAGDLKASSSNRNATLPNPEYFKSKQSAPNPDHTDCFDEIRNISNTGGFKMVDRWGTYEKERFHIHQNVEGPSSRMSKMEQSTDVASDRDGGTADHHVSSFTDNTELEQDLYKVPQGIFKKDSLSEESLRSAVWAEEETAVSALSDGTYVSASRAKLYHEKTNAQKLSHAKVHGNLGSRTTTNNDEDHFMSGEGRNLRELATSREGSLHAASEHLEWEGQVTAVEDRIGHPDLHEMEGKLGFYPHVRMNNALGFPIIKPQPYGFTNHHYGFGASGTSQIYPYPLPSQSLMHPAAFQNHACGYHHAMSPACTICSYHQHAHLQPQHVPHCGVCFGPSGSTPYNAGLVECWDCHQANLGLGSSCAGSLVDYPQASSTSLIQRYDSPKAESRSQASSEKKYPPFPKDGAAPYITCKGCYGVLQVPSDLPSQGMQKLRCGACGKVLKFSANYYGQQRGVVPSTLPFAPELDSMGRITNLSPVISSSTESAKSSYKSDMNKGKPVLQGSNAVSHQTDNTAISRISEQKPGGGEFLRVQPRDHRMNVASNNYGQHDPPISISTTGPTQLQNASSMVGAMRQRNGALRSTDSLGFESVKVNPVALTVDEKEEGLDFGAPRISDGDSLDHSETRIRSPEYNQAGHETVHTDTQGAPSRGYQPLEPVSDLSEDFGTAAQEKMPGSPLLVLLNQESTRFRLNLESSLPFEEYKSALCSPASDSSVYANSYHKHPQKREENHPRSHGRPGQYFVSKGPKYIKGLLRRSLRDFGKGGQ